MAKGSMWKTVFKYGLGVVLLAVMVWWYWSRPTPQGDMGVKGVLERPLHFWPLGVALAIGVATALLSFYRWYVLVRAQDLPFTVPNAMRLGMIGYAFNILLPGGVGGDILKAAFLGREQRRRTVAIATVMLDRGLALCALFWLAAIVGTAFWISGALALMSPGDGSKMLEGLVGFACLVTLASLILWFIVGFLPNRAAHRFAGWLSPKLGHPFAELWRAGWLFRLRGRAVALALILGIIGHVGNVLNFYYASRTLNAAEQIPSLGAHFLLVPFGMTAQTATPTPGGMGGGEAAYGFLYEKLGFYGALGVLACLVQRVLTWIIGFVGYLVYLRMKPSLPVERPPSQPTVVEPAVEPLPG